MSRLNLSANFIIFQTAVIGMLVSMAANFKASLFDFLGDVRMALDPRRGEEKGSILDILVGQHLKNGLCTLFSPADIKRQSYPFFFCGYTVDSCWFRLGEYRDVAFLGVDNTTGKYDCNKNNQILF